jgi:hypothetical protein
MRQRSGRRYDTNKRVSTQQSAGMASTSVHIASAILMEIHVRDTGHERLAQVGRDDEDEEVQL